MSRAPSPTPERLRAAAAQWRAFGAIAPLQSQRELAERTARNLEREAQTGIATCVCCNKPIGSAA
ncbi:MAG: hypothetical protein EON92_15890 [Burkholderiales bacterium]|nr:MAG: hypothetical protein EON92_15890 [Burkholderiales bacterium]